MLLVGPTGQSVLLLSDAGASDAASGVDLRFDDQAAGPAPDPLVSGSYVPTNLIEGFDDPFPAPAPPGPYASALSVFNETDPVGTWSLYLVDDDADVGGSISGWRLTTRDRSRRGVAFPSQQLTANESVGSLNVTVARPEGGLAATVDYAAVPNEVLLPPATAGRDFEPVSGSFDFAPGETSKSFAVPLVDNRALEDHEQFEVKLTAASGDAQLPDDATTTVTIRNDDPPARPRLRGARLQRPLRARGIALTATLPDPALLRARGTITLPSGAATIRLRPARTVAEPGRRTRLFLRLPRRAASKLQRAFTTRRRLSARVTVTATLLGLRSSARYRISLRP